MLNFNLIKNLSLKIKIFFSRKKPSTAVKIKGGEGNIFVNNKISGYNQAFDIEKSKDNKFVDNEVKK